MQDERWGAQPTLAADPECAPYEEEEEEEDAPVGTLFFMMIFLLVLVGLWSMMYWLLLNR